MKIATTLALLGCALESATATFVLSGTAATVGSSTALTLGTGSTIYATSALVGGVVLIKALALAGLAVAASRSRRSAIEDVDSPFAVLAAQEPAQCYRRLICDLATGTLERSENDVIVSLFNKEVGIESPKFDFATAAKLGKQAKSVEKCEIRYNCPLSGEQIQKLF